MLGTALDCGPRITAVQFRPATQNNTMIIKFLLLCYLLFFVYVDILAGRYISLAMDIFIPVVLYGIIVISQIVKEEHK